MDFSRLNAEQKERLRSHLLEQWHQRECAKGEMPVRVAAQGRVATTTEKPPAQAAAFHLFMPQLHVRWDEMWIYVETNTLPSHPMMIGITSWQQHVPLRQDYRGDNAWRIPRHPVPAKEPQSVRNRFLRGAIAVAVNGVPIFNPQNNRGEYSAEIGELDKWGGHCGRADDYHYHVAPLHLQTTVGKGRPIAYALDGYPIHGLTEPGGATPSGLDAFHGHSHDLMGYHYHASTQRPYVNGGFHGVVVERDGQVHPQPRGQPIRGALQPLRGAKITGFTSTGEDSYKLTFEFEGGPDNTVSYRLLPDDRVEFEFDNAWGEPWKESFTRRSLLEGEPRRPRR